MPGVHWKWRMHGAAAHFARSIENTFQAHQIDRILTTDMMDVAQFRGLLPPQFRHIPVLIYMHENQLNYPWSATDRDVPLQRDQHYAYINFSSVLAADGVAFNSFYHQRAFLNALPGFLQSFPDFNLNETLDKINRKCTVLPLSLSLPNDWTSEQNQADPPLILWNHRWEYDKQPEAFFALLERVKAAGIPFRLAVLGKSNPKYPKIFDEARNTFKEEMVHWGFVESRNHYFHWLKQAQFLPVTSIQDFFGGSIVEAISYGAMPLLPNRLAYPEHVPSEWHSYCLYEEGELLTKFITQLRNKAVGEPTALAEFVKKYDWKNQIGKYDEWLQA